MKRLKRSIVVGLGVVVAATAVTGVAVVRTWFGCLPPWSDIQMINKLQADPLFAIAPDAGRLIDERAAAEACDTSSTAAYIGHGVTYLWRRYRTPGVRSLDQLRQRFDQPAAAAGWHIDKTQTHQGGPPPKALTAAQRRLLPPAIRRAVSFADDAAEVTYCRQLGDRLIYLEVQSSRRLNMAPDIEPFTGVSVEIRDPGILWIVPSDRCPVL